jgi:hypothetical protein
MLTGRDFIRHRLTNHTLPRVAMVIAGLFMLVFALFAPVESSPTIWGPAGRPDPLPLASVKIGLDSYISSDTTLSLWGDNARLAVASDTLYFYQDSSLAAGANNIVFCLVEEDGTKHGMRYSDAEGKFRFDTGVRVEILQSNGDVICTGGTLWGRDALDFVGASARIDPETEGPGVLYLGNDVGDTTSVRENDLIGVNGRLYMGSVTYDSTATLGDTTSVVILDMGAGQDTLKLPAASGHAGRMVWVTATNANGAHVDADGAETIDGSAVLDLAQWADAHLFCDGSNWLKLD